MQLSAYGSFPSINSFNADKYYNIVKFTTTTNSNTALNLINTQYWLCTLMDEYEAWSNWRRTGFPVLTPTLYPGTGVTTIPRRLTYPPSQKTTNLANYNAAVARIIPGGDKMTSLVWWDKQ